MDDSQPSKKRYNTKELLSLNMDRLKEYMKRMGKQAADPDNPPVFEVTPRVPKGSTRIGKSPSACRLLALFEDPHNFVKLVAENDGRRDSQRFGLDRAADFRDAVSRMNRRRYDLVIVSPLSMQLEEVDATFGTIDWVLMIRGLMRPSDIYFLAKKRWFVMNLVPGRDNAEKVDNFRKLREQYKEVPLVYLHEGGGEETDVKVIKATPKTRVLPLGTTDLLPLFNLLDELTFGA